MKKPCIFPLGSAWDYPSIMSSDEGERLKELGNNAFREKDFKSASEYFTQAIAVDATNPVYWSNRSGAYCNLQRFQEALGDAEECISNKRTWPRGYGRKGDALWGLGKFDEAIASYKEADTWDTSGGSYAQKAKDCEAAKNTPRAAGVAPETARRLSIAEMVLNMITIALLVAYMLPMTSSPSYFYHLLKVAAVRHFILLIQKHGPIQLNKEYATRALLDRDTHALNPCLVLHMGYPFVLALLPFGARAALSLAHNAVSFDVKLLKGYATQLINKSWEVVKFAATLDVMTGVLLLVYMLTPRRSFVVLFLWWEGIRLRYNVRDAAIIEAVNQSRVQFDTLFYHRFAPAFVGSAWTKLKGFLSTYATQKTVGGGLGSGIINKVKSFFGK